MAGNEGVDGDVSGEEAAWRDLVARFDLPVDTESEQVPWPARENLTESARDRQRPDQDAESGWDDQGPAGRPGPGGRADPGGRPGPASLPTRPGAGLRPPDELSPVAPQGPGAVRPDAADTDATDATGATPDTTDAPAGGAGVTGTRRGGNAPGAPAPGAPAAGGTAPDGTSDTSGTSGTSTSGTVQGPAFRPRIIRRAGPGRPDQVAEDLDEDDRYVPPPPEPLPPLDPVAKGAWAGVLGGPGYLLIAQLADWQIPNWAALLAIVAFVAGFATLVVRMGDHPRDDDDDGAVV